MDWLVTSIVASVVLTVLLNVAIRLWPGTASRGAERLTGWMEEQATSRPDRDPDRVRVIVPWKGMLIASVVLTVLLNLAIWLF